MSYCYAFFTLRSSFPQEFCFVAAYTDIVVFKGEIKKKHLRARIEKNVFMMTDEVKFIAEMLQKEKINVVFNMMEIGARPIGDEKEVSHLLVEHFPGSKIIAFEVDEELCDRLNKETAENITFYPVAVGKTEETRDFYETNHPMCSSLYKPEQNIIDHYNGLEVLQLKSTVKIDTVSLDYFIKENEIGLVDFIKIDIQGAELDVFQGGGKALQDVLAIVTEVEFIPVYESQPLFADVSNYLLKHKFLLHKFLSISGRTLKPIVMNDDENFATQHMWSDAMFIKYLLAPDLLSSEQLLKLAILAYIYQSPDVAVMCFTEYDKREATNISGKFMELAN